VTIRSYRDLKVWQKAMDLAVTCYGMTKGFPREEAFGLTSQIRRAAASVAANIAEGHGRESRGALIQFLRVSQGSLKELETHVILAERVGFLGKSDLGIVLEQSTDCGKMLRALIRSMQEREANE
jgi:four helix bundle protein